MENFHHESMFDNNAIADMGKYLQGTGHTLAVAESVTAGLLQVSISTAMDAMKFFQGGITTYNIGQKTRHLGIDPIQALACNCVSRETAEDMALGVCKLFTAHWGIAVTGYATPVPESGNSLFAYAAFAHNGRIIYDFRMDEKPASPLEVQYNYVNRITRQFVLLAAKNEHE
jgi:nicotinamide-nucleotide amidase